MGTVLIVVLFILGLMLIIKGGDYFVDGAAWIAEVSGIPKFIIGATIVSIGTTLPELIVSSMAAANGQIDMAIGNAIGSVTANTGMILGIFVVCMPFAIKRKDFVFKGLLMFASTVAITLLSLNGVIGLAESIVLFVIFIAFITENVIAAKKDVLSDKPEDRRKIESKKELTKNLIMFLGGAAGIAIGAQLLVTNGTKIAELIGISERAISVVAIAIGTSLPELVTTITALRKKEGSLSVGNILGANIIDMTMIMPISAFIAGGTLTVNRTSIMVDMPVLIAIVALAVFPTIFTKKFHRIQGIIMLVSYAVYLVFTMFILK